MTRPHPGNSSVVLTVAALALLLCGAPLTAMTHQQPATQTQNSPKEVNWERYETLAVQWLREYIRANTSNPPGNEMRAVDFWKRIFDGHGIETHTFRYAPNRGNILAILHGDGSERPIILLNHLDVVTAVPQRWRVPPFSAAMRDGEIYGRGAVDMKSEAVAQAITLLVFKRERITVKRDVIFLGTADEEVNDTGSQYMIDHQRPRLGNAQYLITEGGDNLRDEKGIVQRVGISVMAKAPYWLEITAHGQSGHGSIPLPDSAPNRLVRALSRIIDWQTPIRLLPQVEEFFQGIAETQPEPRRTQFAHLRQSLNDPEFLRWITAQDRFNYMLRDTISLTGLAGSNQTNIIPSQASARLDIRLLPGSDRHQFRAEFEKKINDANITVTELSRFRPPNSSPTDTPLYKALVASARAGYPEAVVVPIMSSGYNESQMYRQLGIDCYGFSPYAMTEGESSSEHSDNERIGVAELKQGQRVLFNAVREIAAK